jgi:hypothetical protein
MVERSAIAGAVALGRGREASRTPAAEVSSAAQTRLACAAKVMSTAEPPPMQIEGAIGAELRHDRSLPGLAMSRLTPCPSCRAHVLVQERQCPHCGATLRTAGAPLAAAVVASLMLGGCPADDVGEPEYGVPLTEGPDTDGGTTAATTSDTGETDGGTTGATATTGDTDVSAGEADYGVAETNPDTTTG